MKKSNYHVKELKDCYKFSYSGDLGEALEKAKKDLQAEKENKEIEHWRWIKKKAESAIKSHESKIARIEAFIRAATRELEKEQQES